VAIASPVARPIVSPLSPGAGQALALWFDLNSDLCKIGISFALCNRQWEMGRQSGGWRM